MQKLKIRPKMDKTKQALRKLYFMALKVRASGGRRREDKKRRRGEEKSMYGMVWNLHMFGNLV